MTKTQILDTLEKLPEEFTPKELWDFIEKLVIKAKIEEGIQAALEGKTISLEEASNRFEERWSK